MGMTFNNVVDLFQVCAANFGDVCNAVGQESTEKYLVRLVLEPRSCFVLTIKHKCFSVSMIKYCTSVSFCCINT